MNPANLSGFSLFCVFACGLLSPAEGFAQDVPRYPFPRDLTYASGTIKPTNHTQAQLDDDVRAFYTYWKAQYVLAAGTDAQGNPLYRISFGSTDPSSTVSEGQGYGMAIVPLMAGYDSNAHAIFDGLLRFALAHPSVIDSRLMAWQVPDAPSDSDSAFDGDADIAYGLTLADAQWGSNGTYDYASLARSRMAGIMASTIGPQSRLPMLGDWVSPNDTKYNQDTPRSSDFMPGHFRAWARFTGNTTWNTVATNCATVVNALQTNYSPATGLLPDFIKNARTAPQPVTGTFLEANTDGYYYYNAGRDPWRLGVDALLNGDATSLTQARMITDWARVKTGGNPQLLRGGYKLDGSNISGNNFFTSFFASPMAVAAMLNPSHPEWLNALYDAVRTDHEDYYEDSVTLQCLLVISGDFWDPTIVPAPPPTAYQTWAAGFGLDPATSGAATADPDGDGQPNLLEFALNGNPKDARQSGLMAVEAANSGAPAGALVALVAAVRRGAGFAAAPDGSQTATIDGIVYTVNGSADLVSFTLPVSLGGTADTAPAGSGLPSLQGSAWTYQTFYLAVANVPGVCGFMRMQARAAE